MCVKWQHVHSKCVAGHCLRGKDSPQSRSWQHMHTTRDVTSRCPFSHRCYCHCHCHCTVCFCAHRPCAGAGCDGMLSIGGRLYPVLVQTSSTSETFKVQPMGAQLNALMMLKSPTKMWMLPGNSQPGGCVVLCACVDSCCMRVWAIFLHECCGCWCLSHTH